MGPGQLGAVISLGELSAEPTRRVLRLVNWRVSRQPICVDSPHRSGWQQPGLNHLRQLGLIGYFPPAEAEADSYEQQADQAMPA